MWEYRLTSNIQIIRTFSTLKAGKVYLYVYNYILYITTKCGESLTHDKLFLKAMHFMRFQGCIYTTYIYRVNIDILYTYTG